MMQMPIDELIEKLTEAKRVYGLIEVRIGLDEDDNFTTISTVHVEKNHREPIHVWIAPHR